MLVMPGGKAFMELDDGDFDIDESVDPTPATPPGWDELEPPVVDCANAAALKVSAIAPTIINPFITRLLPNKKVAAN